MRIQIAALLYAQFHKVFFLTWRYLHTLVFLWTIITLLRQIWRILQRSRQCPLPQPTTQSDRQKQRIKFTILTLYNIKLHFVWKQKKGGGIGKFGVSVIGIKLLVIIAWSDNSEWSLKGQVKYYGNLSIIKCSTDIQWKIPRKSQLYQRLRQSRWLKKGVLFQGLIVEETYISKHNTAVV